MGAATVKQYSGDPLTAGVEGRKRKKLRDERNVSARRE
jgi:hypothetical protein